METLKWVFSGITAACVAVFGIGLAVAVILFTLAVKVLGSVVVLAGFITIYIKEHIDEQTKK